MKKKLKTIISDEENLDSVFSDFDDYNSYYESVSVVFRILSFILFAVLLLFVISTSFIAADEFSYSNLEYITRNFALTLEENKDSTRHPIRYNPDSMNQFDLFGKGLAICGRSSLSIYSATGRLTYSESIQYRNPIMTASGKYVLIYDEGSVGYSIYNSFAKVHSDMLEKPIKSAVLSESGYYALISSSDEYTSTVEVYNSDFVLISRYNKNGYVSSVDITDDEVLIVTADSELGASGFRVEILVSDINGAKNKFSFKTVNDVPLGCKITSDGYCVVLADSVLFLDKNGNVTGNYFFDDKCLSDFIIGQTNVLAVFKAKGLDTGYEIICINPDASVLYSEKISETVFDVALIDSTTFVITENNLCCINDGLTKYVEIDSANYGCRLIAVGNDTLYYCSDTSAMLISDVYD